NLLPGPPAILIDNVRRRLDAAALSAAITASVWEDRLLGSTRMVSVPVRCAWIANGNNPAISDEIGRRAVRTRIDAKMDRPWERPREKFGHLLPSWAAEHRGDLIWAALTLGRAWLCGGRRAAARTLSSFEAWSQVIGGI